MLLAGSLQAAPLPGFKLVAETEHFSYYTTGKLKVDVKKNERFLAKVEKLIGYEVKGRANFYRHERSSDIFMYTGRYGVGGLTNLQTGRIHSTLAYHPHEIVHRVAGELGGDPGVFFHEGLAVALSSKGKWFGRDIDKLAKRAVQHYGFAAFCDSFGRFDMDTSYPVAGSFVDYLIETHGMEKVVLLFATCRNGGSRDAYFARIFSQTIAEAGSAWLASL